MPHQCVRCSTMYPDGSKELLSGCTCGGKLFFFIRKEKLEKAQQEQPTVALTSQQKIQIEKDVLELLGTKDLEEPVILDFESIRVVKPGKYELDLVKIFKGAPLIIKLEEGKYVIDVAETFQRLRKKK